MTRGIIYVVWGKYNKSLLKRSTDSAEKFGYDYTVKEIEPHYEGLINKIEMWDSPYDVTLFLDADTEIKGNIDFGFEMAEKYGLACCIAPASNLYQASFKSMKHLIHKDAIQYNTGVLFWSKDWNWDLELCSIPSVFFKWKELMIEYPESSTNDQVAFSLAVSQNINPFILPNNWNYRAKIRYEAKVLHGDLKILHAT